MYYLLFIFSSTTFMIHYSYKKYKLQNINIKYGLMVHKVSSKFICTKFSLERDGLVKFSNEINGKQPISIDNLAVCFVFVFMIVLLLMK